MCKMPVPNINKSPKVPTWGFSERTTAATGAKMSVASAVQSQTNAGPLTPLLARLASRFQVACKKPAARTKAKAKRVMGL